MGMRTVGIPIPIPTIPGNIGNGNGNSHGLAISGYDSVDSFNKSRCNTSLILGHLRPLEKVPEVSYLSEAGSSAAVDRDALPLARDIAIAATSRSESNGLINSVASIFPL